MSSENRVMSPEDISVLAAVANKQCLTEILRSALERGYDHVPLFVIHETIRELDKLIS
jgi:hypothetical protein